MLIVCPMEIMVNIIWQTIQLGTIFFITAADALMCGCPKMSSNTSTVKVLFNTHTLINDRPPIWMHQMAILSASFGIQGTSN